jgi:hypothetical protein
VNQTEFINKLIELMYVFTPEGRKRIFSDLKRVNTQILCSGSNGNKPCKGVSAFGVPNVKLIQSRLSESDSSGNFIDIDVNWKMTSGVKFSIFETQKAVRVVLYYLYDLYQNDEYKPFVMVFLKELSGNNFSLIRLLSQPKYKSKNPGNKLVGKQTLNNNIKNKGYVLEHTIPLKVLITKISLMFNENTLDVELDYVMMKLFAVWLNTDDDILLKKSGLNSKMPPNWTWDDDPLERYWYAGINKDSLEIIS